MRLGFYYHIPLASREDKLFLPGYIGVFINALAAEVKHLTLFLHEAQNAEILHCDTELNHSNITWINLGLKTPAWHRSIFHRRVLSPLQKYNEPLDCILVRTPSPISPYIQSVFTHKTVFAYFVIGDSLESIKGRSISGFRDALVRLYVEWNDKKLTQNLSNQIIIVNSRALFNRYQHLTDTIHEVRTTTLTASDFWRRSDTCRGDIIRLAYTGRIDLQKGLMELLQAGVQLVQEGIDIEIHYTGWQRRPASPSRKHT